MKTITEFNGFTLKDALALKQQLTQEQKTPEEISAALGEKFKQEGDKLSWLINSLDVIAAKPNQIKRVIVMTVSEGEKAPQYAVQKEAHYFLAEYFPAPPQPKGQPGPRNPRDGKGRDGKRKGRGGGGRGGKDGDKRGFSRNKDRDPKRPEGRPAGFQLPKPRVIDAAPAAVAPNEPKTSDSTPT